MEVKNIKNFRDFNNLLVKVKIGRINYNAIILLKDNYLVLRIDMLNNIECWKRHVDKYELLNGNISYENESITFLNCQFVGKSHAGLNSISEAAIDYRIDRILLGKKLTKQEYKNINKYEVNYNNIDCFTNNKPYIINYKSLEYKSTLNNYDINLKERKISVNFSSSTAHNKNSLSIKRHTAVIFYHNKKINIIKMLENIYIFRNFLMLLLKKAIVVEKQFVYFGEDKYQIFDCMDDTFNEISKDLEEHLNHRCLKIEQIGNISEIYNNFQENYDKLCPLIELYYNVTKYNVPNLTRFVNAITMLEYCSRTFDFNSALNITKLKKSNQPRARVNEPEYKDMIVSLIKNVNVVYKLSDVEIEQIAENIKNARVYYIHYKNKATIKKLSYDEQFNYSYFMQDIILLNIYIVLNLDISSHEHISFLDFYYEKRDLL